MKDAELREKQELRTNSKLEVAVILSKLRKALLSSTKEERLLKGVEIVDNANKIAHKELVNLIIDSRIDEVENIKWDDKGGRFHQTIADRIDYLDKLKDI